MTRVDIDADRCVGHGRCYTLAPQVFDADDFGHSIVRTGDLPEELAAQAAEAERNCPEGAISSSP